MASNIKGKWIELENDKFVRELVPKTYSVAIVKTFTDSDNKNDAYELRYKTINLMDEDREIDATSAIKYVEELPIKQLEQYHKLGNRFRINQILDSLGITAYVRGNQLRPVGDYLEEAYVEMEKRWMKS
ncbi:hypothetical protein P4S95_27940 [Aneurinibacillus aneurinilyticus]|uniref:hypothetical protein n=1 Tax=Aneurinibacillus aneurinilyticus TaxID=1391 RepID=UPI002E1AEF91|nr:hypothetical protein [Aneurinibacillus aneurinilyticus]